MTREEQAIVYFKDMRKRMCEDHLKICPKDSVAYRATLIEKGFYDAAIKALERESKWIPCSERLPVENTTVIGANRYGDIYKTELYDDCGEKKWYSDGSFDVPIVVWMPLPEPYREVEE